MDIIKANLLLLKGYSFDYRIWWWWICKNRNWMQKDIESLYKFYKDNVWKIMQSFFLYSFEFRNCSIYSLKIEVKTGNQTGQINQLW